MSILTVSVLGITAVLLAVQLKGKGGEYGTYIVMAAGCVSFLCGGKLEVILKNTSDDGILHRDQSSVFVGAFENGGNHLYCRICLRICKDAGYGSLGTQIEIFAKLSILAVSMPILLALLETVKQFWRREVVSAEKRRDGESR